MGAEGEHFTFAKREAFSHVTCPLVPPFIRLTFAGSLVALPLAVSESKTTNKFPSSECQILNVRYFYITAILSTMFSFYSLSVGSVRLFDRLTLIRFDLFGAFILSIFNLSLSLVLHPFGSPLPISIVFQKHFSCYADSIFEKKDRKCFLFLHLPLLMRPSHSVVCIVFVVSAALEFRFGRVRRSVGPRRKVQFSSWSYLVWTVGSHLIGLINQIFPTK